MFSRVNPKAFTIGADPEMFLKKDGEYVAVQNCGITGTKDKPQTLPQGGNAQRDNVAVEFAILPADSRTEFIEYIGDTLMDLRDLLPSSVDLEVVPSAHFPKEQLVHKECKMFGCDPDMNAWTMKVNDPPKGAENGTFRSCGGHIHVGFVGGSDYEFLKDPDGKAMMIRVMDCIHGIISTVLDNSDEAIARRNLYGKAGCYRPTEYGVEYRTLSNYWIKSPLLTELMYVLTQDALEVMNSGDAMELIESLGGGDRIQDVISNGKADDAEEMMYTGVGPFLSNDAVDILDKILTEGVDTMSIKEWEKIS